MAYIRTPEIIAKAKKAKHDTLLSRMQWDRVEPFLDAEIDNGSTGRDKTHLTIREYRDALTSGVTQEDLRERDISKHILQFLSNFCQGKITLTKEAFESDYTDGLELDEIAKKHNITRGDLGFLRQLYDIKRTGATYQERKRTEVAMTNRQKEICYGSMMGDAKRQSGEHNTSMGFGHGNDQKEYLFWKFCELESIASKTSFKGTPYTDSRTGYEGIGWRFYTNANSDIKIIIEEFYKSGTKEISQTILDQMTALSVAVWFMDDGKTDWYHRDLVLHPDWKITPSPEFCTECFSYESCLRMQQWFKERWNIPVRLRERKLQNRIGYRLIIENESVQAFFDLIRRHVIPSMLYKVDYEEYKRRRENKKYELV